MRLEKAAKRNRQRLEATEINPQMPQMAADHACSPVMGPGPHLRHLRIPFLLLSQFPIIACPWRLCALARANLFSQWG